MSSSEIIRDLQKSKSFRCVDEILPYATILEFNSFMLEVGTASGIYITIPEERFQRYMCDVSDVTDATSLIQECQTWAEALRGE